MEKVPMPDSAFGVKFALKATYWSLFIAGVCVLAGGDIALTDYATVTGGFVAATDTVNSAIAKLENDLIWHEA